MALKLESTDPGLNKQLRAADADGAMSPSEFQQLRDDADAFAGKVAPGTINAFMETADQLVEQMQRIALDARKAKLPEAERRDIGAAIERQVAYIVAGHKSSTERL